MEPFLLKRLSVMIVLLFFAGLSHAQAEIADVGPESSKSPIRWRGYITPKFGYFDNSGNQAYLNRYDLLGSFDITGNPANLNRNDLLNSTFANGFIADLDFSLIFSDDSGASIFAQKEGYGPTNQRFRLNWITNSALMGVYYSTFKSATGTYEFQYNPDMVAGGTDPRYADRNLNSTGRTAFVGNFNNDSPNVLDYQLRRSNYGFSVVLKPPSFEERASFEFNFDAYNRDGQQVSNYVLDDAFFANNRSAQQQQWRGYAKTINDQNSKLTYQFNFTPQDWFINYEFSIDKFLNNELPVTLGTVSKWATPPLRFAPGVDLLTPLGFVPDSTQYSNALRVNKTFGDSAAVSAGVSYAWLQQDTFSEPQVVYGYNDGRVDTMNGFLTGKFNVSQSVGLEAFARINRRQNDSSYPVPGFYEPVSQYGNPRMVMPRIDSYKHLSYGLEAKLYPSFLKTTWSAGWKYERKDNDLTWGVVPALAPPLSLYSSQYAANEVFMKLVSRPFRGLVLRATPSYLWANQTQLTTDPNEMFKFKSSAIYTKTEWSELAVTGYYNYNRKKNDSLSYSDYILNPRGFANPQYQEATNTAQSVGLNMSVVPVEDIKASLGYDWNQNDLSTYYFATNRLRFDYPQLFPGVTNPNPDVPLLFMNLDQVNYKADTHTFTAGLEKLWEPYLFRINYSFLWATGYNANGLAGQSLPAVDDKIDYQLHTLSLGAEYEWKKDISVRGVYIYDRYQDGAYEATNGSRNTVWIGINYRL